MKDYFVYLPQTGEASAWGVEVTAVGYANVRPGQPYPPTGHEAFSWKQGRSIQDCQLVLISEGSGVFESRYAHQPVTIQAGDVFLLWPNAWHRYRPSPARGWVEHWLECRGPMMDNLQKAGLAKGDPVRRGADVNLLLQHFDHLHMWARPYFAAQRAALSTLVLHLYALVHSPVMQTAGLSQSKVEQAVERAQAIITSQTHVNLNVSDLAEQLEMSESHLRRAFRQRVGLAPKQYHLQVRLRRVRDMLSGTDLSISDIAERLGFDSAFHLSKQFKQHVGIAPSLWRSQMLNHDA